MKNYQTDRFEVLNVLQSHPPQFGMFFDMGELFICQSATLQQNMVRNSDLADIVQQRPHNDLVQLSVGEAETQCSSARI